MKILILVQACDDQPYSDLQKAQESTWNSINVKGVKTLYFLGGKETKLRGNKLYVECSEAYNMMHWRCKLALDYTWTMKWDYIFRTNASSYVDKNLLLEFAHTLNKENVYCGINGGGFASGSGFFLSRDAAWILRNELTDQPHGAEDVAIGETLNRNYIKVTPGAQRFDYYPIKPSIPKVYHYRCKSDTMDRDKDIEAFNKIFSL
jgi:hypothetical protein